MNHGIFIIQFSNIKADRRSISFSSKQKNHHNQTIYQRQKNRYFLFRRNRLPCKIANQQIKEKTLAEIDEHIQYLFSKKCPPKKKLIKRPVRKSKSTKLIVKLINIFNRIISEILHRMWLFSEEKQRFYYLCPSHF